MYYREYNPSRILAPYIRSYFHISVKSGAFHFPADGYPGMIINAGDPFLLGFEPNHFETIDGCRLFGPATRNLMAHHAAGAIDVIAVKFKPGQLPRFFNVPINELANKSASIQTLLGKVGRETEDILCDKDSVNHIIEKLDNFFVKLLSKDSIYDRRIAYALNVISTNNGQVRIEELAQELNLSRRHFERRFLEFVGLTPKRMCRIKRFLGVFSSMKAVQNPDWADIALTHGYSDQAHFIRECKYFTGHTPPAYMRNQSSFEDAIMGYDESMSH